jgi:hypothetical protein
MRNDDAEADELEDFDDEVIGLRTMTRDWLEDDLDPNIKKNSTPQGN